MSRGFSLRDYLRTATALPNGLRAEQSATNGVDDQTPLRAELSSTSGARPSTFCSDPIEALGRQRLSFVRHWSQTCHRAIKRGCAFMLGFKSFANAAITIAGIELAHRIYKRQCKSIRPGQEHPTRVPKVTTTCAIAVCQGGPSG